ncbi:hypothetical protein [Nocardia sp. SSK8]|uniref:hypothetical protein n=1 Tax=Nocardia sp. SSK8 TaxID=3120154 RepID=UPI0030085AA4
MRTRRLTTALVLAAALTTLAAPAASAEGSAATDTGSSQMAGLLFCGLLSLSNGNNPTICDTGIVP